MNVLTKVNNPVKAVQTVQNVQAKPVEVKPNLEYKPDILDKLSDKVVSRRDITDTVTVPRSIFKGYMCFTAGTAINAIAGMLRDSKFKTGLSIAGSLISIYGTYNFVKSFLVKDKSLTESKK